MLVNKPAGISSFGVVARVRQVLNESQKTGLNLTDLDAEQGNQEERTKRRITTLSERQTPVDAAMHQKPAGVAGFAGRQGRAIRKIKVGHTGTLDPAATGLMILVIGKYCKRAAEFSKLDKTYEVEATLGATSSTGDIEGEITKKSTQRPDETELRMVLSKFVGNIYQTPPIYSAIKVNGQRAYKLARAGKQVKIEPRQVTINSIENIEYKYPKLSFTTSVSSGTYIRSLVEDIGANLGTGAYMSALKRTKIANYSLKDSVELEGLNAEVVQEYLKSL